MSLIATVTPWHFNLKL